MNIDKCKIEVFDPSLDVSSLISVAEKAFSVSPDAKIDKWFSFEEMVKAIEVGRGVCVTASDESGNVIGLTYAQQESPINGPEGLEKWVIVMAAVEPDFSGKVVGSNLLKAVEDQARQKGATKMFAYTNAGDDKVIHFYHKNGYEDAGYIKNYQYGKDNSAVFLIKNFAEIE
jgi:ribosomal protein S18 acetylase RimI-like enzyme